EKIGLRWPESRPACVALLMKQLEQFPRNTPEINGFLIVGLVELKATEALLLIERAFAANHVDLMTIGDWEDVQVEFGLKSREEVEQERLLELPETLFPSPEQKIATPHISSKERHQLEATRKKTKHKIANQSRKKNRKQ
ncbi:MAG TPA: hypothetical protein VFN35_05925, partial [Ktedonobacteraceae bacterium]|nr:hypothetical protein [Ktedonobacteraceae bacterium]